MVCKLNISFKDEFPPKSNSTYEKNKGNSLRKLEIAIIKKQDRENYRKTAPYLRRTT